MNQCYDCGKVIAPDEVRTREMMPGMPRSTISVCPECEAKALRNPPGRYSFLAPILKFYSLYATIGLGCGILGAVLVVAICLLLSYFFYFQMMPSTG